MPVSVTVTGSAAAVERLLLNSMAHHQCRSGAISKGIIKSSSCLLTPITTSGGLLHLESWLLRGVGVATAEGLFLNKKLDLLLSYLLVEPAQHFADSLRCQLAALTTGSSSSKSSSNSSSNSAGSAADGLAGPGLDLDATSSSNGVLLQWFNSSSSNGRSGSAGGSSSGSSMDSELLPFASADLQHQWVTTVERRSLRSLMPHPAAVLDLFWKKLVLQVGPGPEAMMCSNGCAAAVAGCELWCCGALQPQTPCYSDGQASSNSVSTRNVSLMCGTAA